MKTCSAAALLMLLSCAGLAHAGGSAVDTGPIDKSPEQVEAARKRLERGLDRFFANLPAPRTEPEVGWPETFPPTQWVPYVIPAGRGAGISAFADIPGAEGGDCAIAACFSPIDPPSPERMLEISLAMQDEMVAPQYQLGTRWTGTAGSPRALTWSFVPDGLSIPGAMGVGDATSPSTLFATMDTEFGAANRATWIAQFQACFDRWQAISGTTYTRITTGGNAWDDGAAFPGSAGSSGVRGDIRIAMHPIDGANGILAYNQFPQGGDMVMDSAENWDAGAPGYRFLRNTVMHEHGHGLGFNHVCPINNSKLMEPFLSTLFDGPQQDDLRAAQRHYGDRYGSNIGAASAAVLATLNPSTNISPSAVPTPAITNGRITSIDTNGENDWFRSNVAQGMMVGVTVTPIGTNYADYAQDASCNTTAVNENALAAAALAVDIISFNGSSIIASNTTPGAGVAKAITGVYIPAGNFYVRVRETDSPTTVQVYDLNIQGGLIPTLSAPDGTLAGLVRVTFTAVSNATSFTIFRNTTNDRPSATSIGTAPAGSTTFDDTTALPGVTYFYWADVTQPGTTQVAFAGPDSGFTVPANNACNVAAAISPGAPLAGTTSGATGDGSSTCGGNNDVWYVYTADCTGPVRFEITSATFDPLLSIHGSCPGLINNQLACNDNTVGNLPRIDFNVAAGTNYRLRVAGVSGATGTFTISAAKPAPDNDDCAASAVSPSGTAMLAFDTCAATTSSPAESCAGGPSITNDLWFRYTAGTDGTHTVETCGSSLDTLLFVYSGTCPASPGAALACNDNTCGAQSQTTFTAVAGADYLVRVGAAANARGTGTLTITPPAAPTCAADFNGDGIVEPGDLDEFITFFFSTDPAENALCDFNGDGFVEPGDLDEFITTFFEAC
ncbi:MAG: matrixin family metalloprotease [Phycisphaerales bacterium]